MLSYDIMWHHMTGSRRNDQQSKAPWHWCPQINICLWLCIIWHHMTPYDVIWCIGHERRRKKGFSKYFVFKLRMVRISLQNSSYDIIWCHMISYDATFHCISHIMQTKPSKPSYDVIRHHMMSYDVTWWHFMFLCCIFQHTSRTPWPFVNPTEVI